MFATPTPSLSLKSSRLLSLPLPLSPLLLLVVLGGRDRIGRAAVAKARRASVVWSSCVGGGSAPDSAGKCPRPAQVYSVNAVRIAAIIAADHALPATSISFGKALYVSSIH